jgi:flagellar protein FliL
MKGVQKKGTPMSDAVATETEPPKKKSKKPVLIGLLLAMLLGGAGFYATFTGLLFGHAKEHAEPGAEELPDIAFVPVEPVVISLGGAAEGRHLRFTSQIEVEGPYQADVTLLLPRILDVLNGYLRAIDVAELEDPAALVRMRAQLLRRIQVVTGQGRVRDLLITEFVLN